MVTAEAKQMVLDLVNTGAYIVLDRVPDVLFAVGLAKWVGDYLYWCQWFPEDQHHFHKHKVEYLKVHDSKNFTFYDEEGRVRICEFEYFVDEYKHWPEWVKRRDAYWQYMPD